MVNPSTPPSQSEEAPAPAEPGIRGQTQYQFQSQDNHLEDDGLPPQPPSLQHELNPSLLHKRLLQAISPSTAAHNNLRPTSSAPDLTRSDSLGASSNSHAHTEHAATPKFYRQGTDVTILTLGNAVGVGEGGGNQPLGDGGGAATPSPRPPLLSKKLLEPKVPIGKNPTLKECFRNTAKYSWLNLLLIAVPVSFQFSFFFCFSSC